MKVVFVLCANLLACGDNGNYSCDCDYHTCILKFKCCTRIAIGILFILLCDYNNKNLLENYIRLHNSHQFNVIEIEEKEMPILFFVIELIILYPFEVENH
ncbi:hypothetical protein LXL04_004358 [Taraxacum kok-saghyz]